MANQIRKVRRSKEVTLEQLAERTGLSTSLLSRMESAKRGLKLENALRIAKALGVEVQDITNEFQTDDIIAIERRFEASRDQKRQAKADAEMDALDIPSTLAEGGDIANLQIHGGMGPGSVMTIERNDEGEIFPDHVNGFWSLPDVVKAGWRHLPAVYSMPVTGDSMEPTLKAGSFVFVDTTHKFPSPEDIYALDAGDGLVIKRVKMIPRTNKMLIISDNERYEADELRREDVHIYGRVVAWFQWRS